ncbi:hypothetical protein KZY98_09930 [Croceibacter atlanticus]|uniref:hypothetical protein n=1 Tax=Croceibacter atlanticus TaxID=313588 RepID=UPI001C5F4CA9|nr:hypothetical protein [Croceibacter atlanticus]MBW4970776.1 hypothetical protein [Croceibacter atlanticus]
MNGLEFKILDCSLQRKLKPIQNLSLIVFTVSWLFIFALLFFNENWASILFYVFISLSIVSVAISIIISIFFFKKKKVGTVIINNKNLIINSNQIYDSNNWYFDLNINAIDKNSSIEKLPFWGNYIIDKSTNDIIEFEPNSNLKEAIDYLEVKNSKRSALSMKTTDLFNNLMSLLWAAS